MQAEIQAKPSYSLRELNQQLSIVSKKLEHSFEICQHIIQMTKERLTTTINPYDDLLANIKKDLKEVGSIDLAADVGSSTICKGGLVLQIIQERLDDFEGDPSSKSFLTELLRQASSPYISMLNNWLQYGIILDPYKEFMINEHSGIAINKLYNTFADRYWEQRYTIRKDGLPFQFLNRTIQNKILLTGKYLNVARECGMLDSQKNTRRFKEVQSIEDRNLLLSIDDAFHRANDLLLSLLLKGYRLSTFLDFFNRFYLLRESNSFLTILDNGFNDFNKPIKKSSISKFQRLLNQHIPLSNYDNYVIETINESLKVNLERENIHDFLIEIIKVESMDANIALMADSASQVKNLLTNTLKKKSNNGDVNDEDGNHNKKESENNNNNKHDIAIMKLTCDLSLPFPLCLIISRTYLLQYQLIFRHFIYLRFVEKCLENAWSEMIKSSVWRHRSRNKRIRAWKSEASALRYKMRLFIDYLLSYCNYDVTEPSWQELQSQISNETLVEDLILHLQCYLENILKGCMLTTEKIIKILSKIFVTIRIYSSFLLSVKKTLILVDYDLYEAYSGKISEDGEYDEDVAEKRISKIEHILGEYNISFDHHIGAFIASLDYYATESAIFTVLSERLDGALARVTQHEEEVFG